MDLQHLAEEDLDGVLRRFISGLGPANLGAVRTDDSVEFTEGEVRVILSADQKRIRDVLWPRRSGGDADAPDVHGDNESGQTG
ncbi:MAG: hypothetical protein M3450_16290 [Actinomycetota bacterium]|nr:hypothetical protein [Actinomycetota bacterium]